MATLHNCKKKLGGIILQKDWRVQITDNIFSDVQHSRLYTGSKSRTIKEKERNPLVNTLTLHCVIVVSMMEHFMMRCYNNIFGHS